MNRNLLIIGASGHGKVIADIAMQLEKYKNIAFLDDDISKKASMGIPIMGKLSEAIKYIDNWDVIVGIGNNAIRTKVQKKLEKMGAELPILVHPSSIISSQVNIGKGTVIMAGTVINCCTSIGKGCIINTGTTIDHDNDIQDFVHLSPGVHLAGSVTIGHESWLGIGAIVKNNIKIPGNCVIGAGSVVLKNICKPGTYVGTPAREI